MKGEVYGQLTVIGKAYTNTQGRLCWRCKCSCGKTCVTTGTKLRTGTTRSCGCLRRGPAPTHGGSATLAYASWTAMMNRCYNPKRKDFMHYGGRGIRVWKDWHDFDVFFLYMGERSSTAMTLERRRVYDDYMPDNCYWANRKMQARNRRNNVLLTYAGETKTMAAWAEQKGLAHSTLSWRKQQGWSDTEIINGRS